VSAISAELCHSLIRCSRCDMTATFLWLLPRRKFFEAVCFSCLTSREYERAYGRKRPRPTTPEARPQLPGPRGWEPDENGEI
jgi:hypothetical protein